jgi:polar amino acid transport system substrate-binding protein
MRSLAAGLLFLLTGAGLLTGAAVAAPAGCQPEKVAQKYPALAGKVVVLGADPQTPPYAMIDEKNPDVIVGSDIELAKAALECVGLKVEVKPGAWPGLFPAVVAGQIDAMFYLYYSPKRVAQGDFVVYMKSGSGVIVQAGNPKNIKSEGDLCGKIVSAGLGTLEEKQVKTLSDKCVAEGKEAIEIMTSVDVPAGFRLIGPGRADAMISDLPLINMMVKRNPQSYSLGYSVVTDYQIGAAVKKKSPLGPALLEGLSAVQAAGVQKEIFAKYGIDAALEIPAELKTK